jgi:hypothetical protein
MEKERTLKVYNAMGNNSELPMVRFQGKWLQRAGFEPGDLIKLKVETNTIIIKNMEMKEMAD